MKTIININGTDYPVKHSIRARLIYEQHFGLKRMWQETTLTDQYVYFWACCKAADPDFNKTYDEFTDMLDDNPVAFKSFAEFLAKALTDEAQMLYDNSKNGSAKN